jgi:hypothetical protein
VVAERSGSSGSGRISDQSTSPSLIPRVSLASFSASSLDKNGPINPSSITGDAAIEGPATAAIPAPAAEPAAEDETTGDASVSQPHEEKAAEASAAIVVEVMRSTTVAVPGQSVDEEPVVTGSVAEPSPIRPVSMLDGKNCDEDF